MAQRSQSPARNGARRGVLANLKEPTPTEFADSTQPQTPAGGLERELAEAISAAICQVSGANGPRPGATADALLTVLAVTLAMSPAAVRSPTTTRRTVDRLAKLLRRRVAAALASQSLGDQP
jgi:hypothetical protein